MGHPFTILGERKTVKIMYTAAISVLLVRNVALVCGTEVTGHTGLMTPAAQTET